MSDKTTVQAEIAALRKVAGALDDLDEECRARVVRWLFDRYAPGDDQSDGSGS